MEVHVKRLEQAGNNGHIPGTLETLGWNFPEHLGHCPCIPWKMSMESMERTNLNIFYAFSLHNLRT